MHQKLVAATLAALLALFALLSRAVHAAPTTAAPQPVTSTRSEAKSQFSFFSVVNFHSTISDPRVDNSQSNDSAQSTTHPDTLSLSEVDFGVEVPLFVEPAYSANLNLLLPIRGVSSSNANVANGTEFGGITVSINNHFQGSLDWSIRISNLQSNKLHLFNEHYEASTGLYLERESQMNQGMIVKLRAGPELSFPFATSNRENETPVTYGMQWGARFGMGVRTAWGPDLRFRFGVEGIFRRVQSYSVDHQEQGGAGLFAIVPSIDYQLLENLWLGTYYSAALSRPAGREAAFANTSLPGLYGNSFGISLSLGG